MIADPHCPNAMGVGWTEYSVTVTKQETALRPRGKRQSPVCGELLIFDTNQQFVAHTLVTLNAVTDRPMPFLSHLRVGRLAVVIHFYFLSAVRQEPDSNCNNTDNHQKSDRIT